MKSVLFRIYFYVICICVARSSASGSRVPVFIWGVNSDKLNLKPVSALETVEADQFRGYLQKILNVPETTLIAFVQERLSLEDLTMYDSFDNKNGPFHNLKRYLDLQSSSVLPSVEDLDTVLEEMKNYRVTNIDLEESSEPRSLISVVENSDIIIVNLPYAEIIAERKSVLKHNDDLIGKYLKDAAGGKKNVVALYTGILPSWEQSQPANEPHVRVARHILAEDELATKNSSEPVMCGNCSLVYLEKVELQITFENSVIANASLSFPSSYVENFSCGSNDTLTIGMLFTNMTGSENTLGLVLDFAVLSNRWFLKEAVATVADETFNMTTGEIGAPTTFSYSCGKLYLHPRHSNSTYGYIMLKGFQIQPFVNGNYSLRFSDSFDCVPFFTIPIWMGLFVTLTFTFILAVGIYALFDVKTMDRFDDPKGKTVSVPISD